MRKSKRISIKATPTFAVVVDGETEVWYLQMLKRNERKINVNIEPRIPQKKTILEQFKMVSSLAEDYTNVFWIVDLDVIIKESREAKKGTETPLQLFIRLRNIVSKNVITIVNNPCIEFWFLLHFEKTTKYFNNCESAEKQLKKHIKDYEKSQRYFTKQDDDIYIKLKPYLKNALKNSPLLGTFDKYEPNKAMCEMELFFNAERFNKYFE